MTKSTIFGREYDVLSVSGQRQALNDGCDQNERRRIEGHVSRTDNDNES